MTDISDSGTDVLAIKDGLIQRPIPTAWRSVLSNIVNAFAHRDYSLKAGVVGVTMFSISTPQHIEEYIVDYNATLIALPDETWDTSVCIWSGNHWDVLVDLWTQEEGRSDMVLSLRVTETKSGFLFDVYMVYVP